MEPIEKWNRFIAGDDDAYASLYEEYVQDLYQYGLCFTSDTELVKDCIQDLFVYLYANRSHLDYVLPFCPGVTYGRYMPTDGFELSVGPKLDSAFLEKNTRSVRRFVLISVFYLSGKIFY